MSLATSALKRCELQLLKPMIYKISGVWGHEGLMLLWVLILHCSARSLPAWTQSPARSSRLAVQALVSVGFLLFIILTSNPFERLVPTD